MTTHKPAPGSQSRPRPVAALGSLVLSAVLVLSACGGGASTEDEDIVAADADPGAVGGRPDDNDPAQSRAGDDNGEPDNNDQPGKPDDNDDSGEPDRLADYLGVGPFGTDSDEQRAYYTRQEQRVQELIAECMAREGFEYIPAVRPIPDLAFQDVGADYAREFGFGITTTFGEDAVFGPDDGWTDPNQAITEAMTESEREAYQETLWSPPSPSGTQTDPDTGEQTEIFDSGFGNGCQAQAHEKVYNYEGLQEVYEQLDLESMYERMQNDPRAQAITDDWSQCMSSRGYDYEDPDAMYESVYTDFQDRLAELTGSQGGLFDPFEGLSQTEIEELATDRSPEEMQDLFAQAQQEAAGNVDQEALAALQAEERDLAVANAECLDDMLEQIEDLTAEYEAEFIEDNRALLEQARNARGG